MKSHKLTVHAIMVLFCAILTCGCSADAKPKNIVILIGDGMGFEQVKAAGIYDNGAEGSLFLETLPYSGEVTTYAANNSVTDSAAAATAIATGVKVNNGVISIANPGDGTELYTLLEHYQSLGKSVGLVTTTYITHATPAAFGAHDTSRNNTTQIAQDYLTQSMPEVLMGGAKYVSPTQATAVGYTVVENKAQMDAIDTETAVALWGQFGEDHLPYEADGLGTLPDLSEMTAVAMDILDNNPEGMFVMIEGGKIDHAGHSNHLLKNVMETIEFDETVEQVYNWAKDRDDTLIIVTADHETGGLTVTEDTPVKDVLPSVTWSSTGHTGVNVGYWAWGLGADRIPEIIDNTDFFHLIADDCLAYCDFHPDGIIDESDLAMLASKWMDPTCNETNNFCNGINIDHKNKVQIADLAIFTRCWLAN